MLVAAELIETDDSLRPTQHAFLEAVMETGSITNAADALGIGRRTPYSWIESEEARGLSDDPSSFTHALAQAKKAAGERAAGRVFTHSMETQGMPGVIASIAYAKRYDPGWNDQLSVNVSGKVLHGHVDLNALPSADKRRLLELATKAESRDTE